MQQTELSRLTDLSAFTGMKPKKVKKGLIGIMERNNEALKAQGVNVTDETQANYERTPTVDELAEMRKYAIDYKKANKKASKREVRRAIQAKFKIRIYK